MPTTKIFTIERTINTGSSSTSTIQNTELKRLDLRLYYTRVQLKIFANISSFQVYNNSSVAQTFSLHMYLGPNQIQTGTSGSGVYTGTTSLTLSSKQTKSDCTLSFTSNDYVNILNFYQLDLPFYISSGLDSIIITHLIGSVQLQFTLLDFPVAGEIISSSNLDVYNRLVTVSDYNFNHSGAITATHGKQPFNNTTNTNGSGDVYVTSSTRFGQYNNVSDPITTANFSNLADHVNNRVFV